MLSASEPGVGRRSEVVSRRELSYTPEDLRRTHHLILQCPWSIEVWQALEHDCGLQLGSLQTNSWRDQLRRIGRSSDENALLHTVHNMGNLEAEE